MNFVQILREEILAHDGCWRIQMHEFFRWREQRDTENTCNVHEHVLDMTPDQEWYTFVLLRARPACSAA